MQITYKGIAYEAEKIIKKEKSVIGYSNEQKIFEIINYDNDDLKGEYIEEISETQRLEALENAMLELVLGGMD